MMTAIMNSDQVMSVDPGRAVVCGADGCHLPKMTPSSPCTTVLPGNAHHHHDDEASTTSMRVEPAETVYLDGGALRCVDLRGREGLGAHPNALRDWYNIMLESFPNPNEFDQLESFSKMLLAEPPYEHMKDTTASHLIVCLRGEDEVLGGIHFEYHAHCKSALLAYVVVSAKTRGMGIGKKLFDTAVRMLQSAHPEIEAIFAETHGMSVEDGVYPTAHRQKYFADLGFLMVDLPYITPILPGRQTPCFDYLLIVRPVGQNSGDRATGIRTSMVRTFVGSYWEYVSRHLYPKATDGPFYSWLVQHGGLAVCREPYMPSLVSYTTEDTEDDYNPGIYTPLLETPWDFTMHEEMLDYFFFDHVEQLPNKTAATSLLNTFLAMGHAPCGCARCSELFEQCQQALLVTPPTTEALIGVEEHGDGDRVLVVDDDDEHGRRLGGFTSSSASSSSSCGSTASSPRLAEEDDLSWEQELQ